MQRPRGERASLCLELYDLWSGRCRGDMAGPRWAGAAGKESWGEQQTSGSQWKSKLCPVKPQDSPSVDKNYTTKLQ